MATIDFYSALVSAPCRSVLMTARAVGVNLNVKVINILAGETRTDEFVKMNIQHTIPTMCDDGFYLNESRAMLQYLANKYGGDKTQLYPTDAEARARVDMRLFFDMGTLYARFAEAYYPTVFAGQPLLPEKLEKLDEAFKFLEHYLTEEGGYVAGNHLTIADFAVVATVATVDAFGYDLGRFPKSKEYLAKLKGEIDGYQELNQEGADEFGGWAKEQMQKVAAGGK